MPGKALNKERWTLTFDAELKKRVQKAADQLHVYPVQVLETLVREQLNGYGLQSIRDSITYVDSVRKQSRYSQNKKKKIA